MYSRNTVVKNKTGFHARPASDLVLKANEFKASVTIRNLDAAVERIINAKSILSILAASIKAGTKIQISAEGDDEVQAVNELVVLVESGFSQ